MFDTDRSRPGRASALAAALRFARIPVICAALVALASTEPQGRVIALVIAVAVVCAAFALHAREILSGGGPVARGR